MFRQRLQRLQRLQKQKQKQFQKQFQKQKQNLKNNRVLRMETGTQMMIMSEVLRSEMIYLFIYLTGTYPTSEGLKNLKRKVVPMIAS